MRLTQSGRGAHHSEEDAKLRVHLHVVTVGKQEVLAALLLAGEHDGDLLRCHRQDWQVDAVKLVKTAPGTRLGQTWETGEGHLAIYIYSFSRCSNPKISTGRLFISTHCGPWETGKVNSANYSILIDLS